jgi:hypothetical protein
MYKLLILLALVLCGCPPVHVPDPPKDTELCGLAEQRLLELECRDPRGQPMWVNALGIGFGDSCREAQEQGKVFVNPRCIAGAPTCEEADQCPTR